MTNHYLMDNATFMRPKSWIEYIGFVYLNKTVIYGKLKIWKRNKHLLIPWLRTFKIHLLISLIIYLKKAETEDDDLSSDRSVLKCLQQLGLRQSEARSRELSPGLPYAQLGIQTLDHHLLSSRGHISSQLELEVMPGHKTRHCAVGCVVPGGILNTLSNSCPPKQIFLTSILSSGKRFAVSSNYITT